MCVLLVSPADDLWGLLDVQAATPAEQFQLHQSQHEAAAHLRHLIAAAVTCDKPVLSEGAQAFLGGCNKPRG
jgi:hypothetical protein